MTTAVDPSHPRAAERLRVRQKRHRGGIPSHRLGQLTDYRIAPARARPAPRGVDRKSLNRPDPVANPPPFDARSPAEPSLRSIVRHSTRRASRTMALLAVSATAYWYYALATLFLAVAVPFVAGWHSTTVMTGSMEPVISPGDVVTFDEWTGETLPVGTIIQFEDPVRIGETTTHRVIDIDESGRYLTKGDANETADSTPVDPDDIVGVATLVSPYAGLPQYWWATRQMTWFVGWVVVTLIAASIMTVRSRREMPVKRSWVKAAVAIGLVAALGGVGTAAWSSAAFVGGTANPDSSLAAASSFADVTHHGSLGIETCSTTTSSQLTLSSHVPAGRTVIIRFAMRNRQENATYGATDTQGNVYTVDAVAENGGRTRTVIMSGSITTPLSPGDRITVTHTRARAVVVSFDEFSGIAAGAPVSTSGAATGDSDTPSVTLDIPDDNTVTIVSLSLRGRTDITPSSGTWSPLDSGEVFCNRTLPYEGAWVEKNTATTVTFDPILDDERRWAVAAVAYLIG